MVTRSHWKGDKYIMKTMYPADNVGKDGTVYPTVGEHIREASDVNITAESIAGAITNNTDRAKVCDALDVTAENLKTAIVNLLTGKTAYFGGLDIGALTSTELADIKTHLGIV